MNSFDNSEFEKYNAEAREKWGKSDAFKEHEEKTAEYSTQKWNELSENMEIIMEEFAFCMNKAKTPASAEAQALVKKLQSFITENYYLCSNEILFGLAQMYTGDERFKSNIDKHADGTAIFIREAVEIYCGRLQ